MDDVSEFEETKIHGLVSLVRDERRRLKLRRADPAKDRPEDVVLSPADLPDARVSIHVFESRQDLIAWSAKRVHRGEICSGETYSVVVDTRYPPREGATLEEAVERIFEPPGYLRRSSDRSWPAEIEALRRSGYEPDWEKTIRAENLVVRSVAGPWPDVTVTRCDHGGFWLTWTDKRLPIDHANLWRISPALRKEYLAKADELGLRRIEGPTMRTHSPTLDPDAMARWQNLVLELDDAAVEMILRKNAARQAGMTP